jgi:hypothetical protein
MHHFTRLDYTRRLYGKYCDPHQNPDPTFSMLQVKRFQRIEIGCNTQNQVDHVVGTSPLKAFGAPDASLRSRFIISLGHDSLAQKYRDNPPEPWSWQDGLLLYDNLVYGPHDDALRIELMQTYHDDPLAGHNGVIKTLESLLRNYYFPSIHTYVKKYMYLRAMYAHAGRHRGAKSSMDLHHSQILPVPGNASIAILSSIFHSLTDTIPSSYLSTG